jgi:hypothetical protein
MAKVAKAGLYNHTIGDIEGQIRVHTPADERYYHRRLPVCVGITRLSLYVCTLFHLLNLHSSHQRTVSKTELGYRYDAIDMKCNLAHRTCYHNPAKVIVHPSLAI